MTIVTRVSKSVRTTSISKTTKKEAWQVEMRDAFRSVPQLIQYLGLHDSLVPESLSAHSEFPIFVPRFFANKIEKSNGEDPLLRQILPTSHELLNLDQFQTDPVGDSEATLQPGIIQKYYGRALLIATGACAIHCRYCFRRHFPYHDSPNSVEQWSKALQCIQSDKTIDEVIFSGGDPLTLSDGKLRELIQLVERIPHVSRIRIHSRLPIVIPSRISNELLSIFTNSRLSFWMVVHANHPNEICERVGNCFRNMQSANVTVLNQAVLLARVNDTLDSQFQLCRSLIHFGVIPYYLHHLDPVRGASHFQTSIELGKSIIEGLRKKLPGFAVPRFVKEIKGEPYKKLLA